MLVEQNYEYLSKLGRKIIGINKNEYNENKNNENDEFKKEENNKNEKIENNKEENKNNEKEKSNEINKEKKLINLHINKIKLIYKQQ